MTSPDADFFILLDDQPSLDFGGMRFEDGQGAAAPASSNGAATRRRRFACSGTALADKTLERIDS